MVDQKLSSFLEKNRKDKNKTYTHTIYSDTTNIKGSYTIDNDKLEEFYTLVHKSIFKKKDKFTLVEKIQQICPFIVDLDLKFKEDLKERQYNDIILNKIINDTFSKMDDVYTMSNDQKVCWIMEKDKIKAIEGKDYKSKDGIHLLFPYIIADKKAHRILRNHMIESNYHKYFEDEGKVPPMNSMEEIIDECIYKSGNWMVYGCGKPNDQLIYKLTKIYKLTSSGLLNLPIDTSVILPSYPGGSSAGFPVIIYLLTGLPSKILSTALNLKPS